MSAAKKQVRKWGCSLLRPDHVLLQIPQHPQLTPVRAVHATGPAGAFLPETFSQGLLALKDRVHELRRPQHRAVAKIPHSVTQRLTYRHDPALLDHGFHLCGFYPATSGLTEIRVSRDFSTIQIKKDPIARRRSPPILTEIGILQGFAPALPGLVARAARPRPPPRNRTNGSSRDG